MYSYIPEIYSMMTVFDFSVTWLCMKIAQHLPEMYIWSTS